MTTLELMAREMASEAQCFGLSKISYDDSEQARQDVWKAIAAAGLLAIRDEVGRSIIDAIIAPQGEKVT